MQQVDTGDIIMFRCVNSRFALLGPWVTRAITSSHFDHVGMILRFGETLNDLFVMEAVGDRGVRIVSWARMRTELYGGGFFDKIVTRKLLHEMTPEKLGHLD